MSERHAKIGQREDYRARLKCVETEIFSLRDSLRAALPLTADAGELAGDHVESPWRSPLTSALRKLEGPGPARWIY